MGKLRKTHKRKKKASNIFILLVLAAVLIAILFLFQVKQPTTPEGETPGGELPSGGQTNCGDLQIDINSIKEAESYTRGTLENPALQDNKFVILNMTVTNKGDLSKDFSGYSLSLKANGNNYSPRQPFSKIDKITLLDGTTINYFCTENKLASLSRLVLGAEESESGCKIFQVSESSITKSISIYQQKVLKCVIQL